MTIKDLAAKTGYSNIACSMAVNRKPGLSQETSDYIREVAEKIGYVPNLSTRAMRNGESGIVLILTKKLDNAALEPSSFSFFALNAQPFLALQLFC